MRPGATRCMQLRGWKADRGHVVQCIDDTTFQHDKISSARTGDASVNTWTTLWFRRHRLSGYRSTFMWRLHSNTNQHSATYHRYSRVVRNYTRFTTIGLINSERQYVDTKCTACGRLCKGNKLAPCGTDDRLFTTDVSVKFKVAWHSKLGQISKKIRPNQI